MKPKMNQKGLEIVFFTKNAFFCGNFLCGTYAFVGNNSEFLGGSPTISATLAIAFTFFNGSQHHCLNIGRCNNQSLALP